MGKDSKTWKAKCIDTGYERYWDLGDIITVEDNIFKVITDCNGNVNMLKTEVLKGDRIVGINDLNFRMSGEWEIIADEPTDAIEKEKDMGAYIYRNEDGDFYKLTEDGTKQILGTLVSEIDQDAVNPNHYKNKCSLECIDSMLMAFGIDTVYYFCICNAWKYMWRYQNKNGVEDIKKARWYVNKASELIPEYLEWQNINEVLTTIERDMIERA